MEMSKEQAANIVSQLQQAHRISVAFYQRILPTFDLIANQFGCTFHRWEPINTSLPSRSKSQPSESWAWDYVPLYASKHIYFNVKKEKSCSPQDFGMVFYLNIENSFSAEACKGQPDPISMTSGDAVIEVAVYRPKMKVGKQKISNKRSLDFIANRYLR